MSNKIESGMGGYLNMYYTQKTLDSGGNWDVVAKGIIGFLRGDSANKKTTNSAEEAKLPEGKEQVLNIKGFEESSNPPEAENPFENLQEVNEFRFDGFREVLDKEKQSNIIRDAAAGYRGAVERGDFEAARDHAITYVDAIEATADEKLAGKIVRALVNSEIEFTKLEELLFLYMDKFSTSDSTGRTICKTIVNNDAIGKFEAYIQTKHSVDEIRQRSAFYAELQRNFIAYTSK